MFKNLAQTVFIGKNIIYLPTCHSTNDYAIQLVKSGEAAHGALVITDNQTNGRGQRGNKWLTEPGKNLTFSIILATSDFMPNELFKLNMAVSMAIQDALQSLFQSKKNFFKVKWPNDIYYSDKKLGGILIENSIKPSVIWSVIGIGINVNQIEFNYLNATSLAAINSTSLDRNLVLEAIAVQLEKSLMHCKSISFEEVKNKYQMHLYRFGVKARFKANENMFEGMIVAVDQQGKLGIQTDTETRFFDLKEVVFM